MTTKPDVHVIQRFPPALGGAESYFARLSHYIAQQGEPVHVHTSNALALEAFWLPNAQKLPAGTVRSGNVKIHRHAVRTFPGRKVFLKSLSMLPHPWVQGMTLPASPTLPSLWSKASSSRERVKLIHASAFPYTFPLYCGLYWARRLNIPFLLTPFLHLGDTTQENNPTRQSYLSPPLRYLLQQADHIFVQTQLEHKAVASLGIDSSRIILQGLGVDPAECTQGSRERADHRWQLPAGLLRIGHLANLSEEKGSVDLLRAACLLYERKVPFTLILAGPAMPNFRRVWKTLPQAIKQHVRILDVLPEEAKPDFYTALDIFALPSRSDSFGLVLLEAWANAIPCVGYRAGGIAEVIQHEQDGLLTPCGDIHALTDAIQQLLNSQSLREKLGQQGQTKIETHHRWADKLEIVRQVYQSVS